MVVMVQNSLSSHVAIRKPSPRSEDLCDQRGPRLKTGEDAAGLRQDGAPTHSAENNGIQVRVVHPRPFAAVTWRLGGGCSFSWESYIVRLNRS
jgi:hypothetical protein